MVRAAVRHIKDEGAFFREVLDEIAEMGAESEWSNVSAGTLDGVKEAISYVRSYDLPDVEILAAPKQSDLIIPHLDEVEGCRVQRVDWLYGNLVVAVPEDRSYLGFLSRFGSSRAVSVVHNPSPRGGDCSEMTWIREALDSLTLTEEAEGYLLGRGARVETYQNMGEGVWTECPHPNQDPDFVERYGAYGESLVGLLVCPLYTPRGEPVGFEAKSMQQKYLTRYLVRPKADWNPIWVARTDAAEKLWAGGEAWIVEGRFDLYPLEWIVPPEDVVLASVRGGSYPETH